MTSNDIAESKMAGEADASFDDVFAREGSDKGADTAAPVDSGPPRDEVGRFAPKQETTPPPVPETPPPPTPTPEAQPTEQAPRHVPLSELMGEREKRKSEATRREEAERRASDVEARYKQLADWVQSQRQPQQQSQNEVPQPPDPYDAPAVFEYQQRMIGGIQQQFARQLAIQNANFSEQIARQKYGNEAVEAAQKAALEARAGEYFLARQNPYEDLMSWHKQQTFIQKVGKDPDAYEKSIEQRAYEKALADLRAGKAPVASAPQTTSAPTRFPGSLADATATGRQGQVLTDEAIAADIFSPTRNRRAS